MTDRAKSEIAYLESVAADPSFSVTKRATAVLIVHQRMDASGCLCGWGELGQSQAGHQAEKLAAAGLLKAER